MTIFPGFFRRYLKYLSAFTIFFISIPSMAAPTPAAILSCRVERVQGSNIFTYDNKSAALVPGSIIDIPLSRLTENGDTYTYQALFTPDIGKSFGTLTISRADGTFRYEVTMGGALSGSVNSGVCTDPVKVRLEAREWRKHIVLGSDSHCGLVVDLKPSLAKVQTAIGEKWFKLEQLEPAGSASCNFSNGVYEDVKEPAHIVLDAQNTQSPVTTPPNIDYHSWVGKMSTTVSDGIWIFSSPAFSSASNQRLSKNTHVTIYEVHINESGKEPDYVRISPDGAPPQWLMASAIVSE
jgi:hypothetical protein